MSILEAWAYRLPVFMTAACNLPQGFALGAALEIAAEPTCMAKALASGLGDSRRHADLGRAGYTLVEQTYTWDRIIADMRHLYAWVLGTAGQPSFVQLYE